VTARLRPHADGWRDIAALDDDDAAAELIRADGIDVLVDLAGHMAKNRLLVLARRRAAVQATYLGYPNGTFVQQVSEAFAAAAGDVVAHPRGRASVAAADQGEEPLR
jgi:predicted O-linked N-acetylglucosamine transferase (SPINDLY family)